MKNLHVNKLYLFAVVTAALGLAQVFGAPLSDAEYGGVQTFLAVLFGVKAGWDDPRIPIGKT